MANGMVWVSPKMLPAKVMVAPNSPRLLLKLRIKPETMPFFDKGIKIVIKTFICEAPKDSAANNIFLSTDSNDCRIDLTNSGKAMTADAIVAAIQVNEIE